jgi:molybdopterin/thiamine biosynthesis adenylyltransferase
MPPLTPDQVVRYSRHIVMKDVGGKGQRKLLEAKVLLVGAGGLGSPAAIYLAAAGVGTLGLVDYDQVDETNLQRQILYGTADVGKPKTECAARTLHALNPDANAIGYPLQLTSENALDILGGYDVILNCSDNFPTRYLVNDACVMLGKPLVDGSVLQFEGQLTVHYSAAGGPCYRCLFPAPPPPGEVPSCAQAGVLGVLPGIIGSLQALEALKLILGIGEPLVGRLLIFDGLTQDFTTVAIHRDPQCPVCGEHPTVTQLIDYEAFCGIPHKELQE